MRDVLIIIMTIISLTVSYKAFILVIILDNVLIETITQSTFWDKYIIMILN